MTQEDGRDDEAQVTEPAPPEVSPEYLVSLVEKRVRLHFPEFDYDPQVFIEAEGGLDEADRIFSAGFALQYQVRPEARHKRPDKRDDADVDTEVRQLILPNTRFLAACIVQITDYSFPVQDKTGEKVTRHYDKSGKGDNPKNAELYRGMLGSPFRTRIEGFLDYVAGRTTDAQRDFADLLVGQPELLRSM